jgi:hypothetical protein
MLAYTVILSFYTINIKMLGKAYRKSQGKGKNKESGGEPRNDRGS